MTDAQERKLDKFKREQVFLTENAADFTGAATAAMGTNVTALVSEIEAAAAVQISGLDDRRQAFDTLEDARDEIEEDLRQINLAARAADDGQNGIAAKFRAPYRPTDETLLATARSFHADTAEYEAQFEELGLPNKFRADLLNDIDAFEAAADATDSALEGHAQASGALNDAFSRGMAQSKKHDAIVRLKYRNDPGKLAAWTVASHLERPPKKPKPPTP